MFVIFLDLFIGIISKLFVLHKTCRFAASDSSITAEMCASKYENPQVNNKVSGVVKNFRKRSNNAVNGSFLSDHILNDQDKLN